MRIRFALYLLVEYFPKSIGIVAVQHQISHHHGIFAVVFKYQPRPLRAEMIGLFFSGYHSEALERLPIELLHAVTHEFIERQIQNAVDNGVFALRIVAQAVDQNVLLSCRGGNVSDCCGLCRFIV